MQERSRFLRQDVYFEPLVNHWYAWAHLLPPVQAARHVVNNHRPIMRSFVRDAKWHALASKEPTLAGGEFLNYREDQVPEIQKLIEEINSHCSDLISLSEAVSELDELLLSHKNGQTIEHLYAKIPTPLKGYVELFMDMEHRPSYRLIEPLLYESRNYKRSLQSLSFGLLSRVSERPFVLSTPRLPDDKHLHLQVDFASPVVDDIFRTRQDPLAEDEVERLFAPLSASGGLKYLDLFENEEPRPQHEPVRSGVRLRYTGHAGFVIETSRVTILVDPMIPSRDERNRSEALSFSELPRNIDYILLTHSHSDHFNLETLLQLRFKTRNVIVPRNNGGTLADPSIRLALQKLSFRVMDVDDLEEISVSDGRIVSLPFLGEHGDLNIRSKTAWFVELLGRRFFFGADSSNLDPNLYRHLAGIFGQLDVLAIGMECVGAPYTWVYGALHTRTVPRVIRESRRLNGSDSEQALEIVKAFRPKRVYVYALGQEPWYKYFMGIQYNEKSKQILESGKFTAACRNIGIEAETLYGKHTLECSAGADA